MGRLRILRKGRLERFVKRVLEAFRDVASNLTGEKNVQLHPTVSRALLDAARWAQRTAREGETFSVTRAAEWDAEWVQQLFVPSKG
jgi:hypothetical protein